MTNDDDTPAGDPLGPLGAIFGQIASMMGSGNQWEAAAQMAASIANEGRSESNLDPADRIAIESLARVAELQVAQHTGMDFKEPIRVEAMNRTQWSKRFLNDQRPLIEGIAGSLGEGLAAQLNQLEDVDEIDVAGIPGLGPMPPEMLRQVMSMMGPMMLSMMAGSTAGHLAARAFGHYELPLPRPVREPLSVVLSNVDEFAQDWSLPPEDIRLWVCMSDTAHHQVLSIPHVRDALYAAVGEYTKAFSTDPEEIERQGRDLGLDEVFEDMGGDMAALQNLAGDPDRLLGVMQSQRQREIMPTIQALVAIVEGWVDHVLDQVGSGLLSEYARVTEALRRRRVEAGPQTRFVERLFGLELSQATFDSGNAFVEGVLARADSAALAKLWADPANLPTPNELRAPGLWMARLGIEARELPMDELDIPDAPDF